VSGPPVFQLYLPLIERNTFAGTLVVEYSVDALLRNHVPPDVMRRHMIAVVDDRTSCWPPPGPRRPAVEPARADHQRSTAGRRRDRPQRCAARATARPSA
jgi:hypothetical protein